MICVRCEPVKKSLAAYSNKLKLEVKSLLVACIREEENPGELGHYDQDRPRGWDDACLKVRFKLICKKALFLPEMQNKHGRCEAANISASR